MNPRHLLLYFLLLAPMLTADVLIDPRLRKRSPGDARYTITIEPRPALKGKVLVVFQDGFEINELKGYAVAANQPFHLYIGSWGPGPKDSIELQSGYLLVLDAAEYKAMFTGKKTVVLSLDELRRRNAMPVRNLYPETLNNFFQDEYGESFAAVNETFALLQGSNGYYLYSIQATYYADGKAVKQYTRNLPGNAGKVKHKEPPQESGIVPTPLLVPAVFIALFCFTMVVWLSSARTAKQRRRHY